MEIRKITDNDDLTAIGEIYETSWKYAYKDIIPMEWMDSRPKKSWCGKINQNGRTDMIVLCDGRIVGTASFGTSRWEKFKDYGEIVAIYLLPEFMGKGIGSALIEHCISELQRCGFGKILLWVLEKNIRARKFYEKHGFVLTDEFMDDNIGGRDVREIMYVLSAKSTG